MAALALTAPENQPGRQSIFLNTDQIDVRDRLREIDWVWAEALAAEFLSRGMQSPIEVTPAGPRWRLVIGAHRWAAHTLLERPIECFVFEGDWADVRAREITENLMRRELSALDRAAFIAELYEVEKARHGWSDEQSPQAFAASKRWAQDASANLALASGLAEKVAERIGLSRRQIFRDLKLHKGLTPDLYQALAQAAPDAPASLLDKLTKLPLDQQHAIARQVATGVSLAAALDSQKPARPTATPEQKRYDAFIGAWSRMSLRERKAALGALDSLGLPKGYTLTTPERADD